MLCCFPTTGNGQHAYNSQVNSSTYAYNAAASNGGGGGPKNYPGQRRPLVKTQGNALMAAPPQQQQQQQHAQSSNNNYGVPQAQQPTAIPNRIEQQTSNLISVTVPPGVRPGQTINVATPDGSGRLISAMVPPGMTTGSKFIVQVPPASTAPPPPVAPASAPPSPPMAVAEAVPHNSNAASVQPHPASDPAPFAMALNGGGGGGYNNSSSAYHAPKPYVPQTQTQKPQPTASDPAPFSMALDVPPPQQQQQQQQPPKQSGYLKVQVPPGTAPGTTLHVQIPNGGGKMVAAQVPPNCSEFHVQYTL